MGDVLMRIPTVTTRLAGESALVLIVADAASPAFAQTVSSAGQQDPAGAQAPDDEIVVTGFRASLENALNLKRQSNQIIDAITAEDVADFPDANLAESIQRLPGVSIDRDNGGRSITIRGLGGDFQQTRLNAANAQSVAGGNEFDAGANRSRGFDFNTFASELFGGVEITKWTSAVNDEGSLGAIIDLTTGRPLSLKTSRFSIGAEAEYRENGRASTRASPGWRRFTSPTISDFWGRSLTRSRNSRSTPIAARSASSNIPIATRS